MHSCSLSIRSTFAPVLPFVLLRQTNKVKDGEGGTSIGQERGREQEELWAKKQKVAARKEDCGWHSPDFPTRRPPKTTSLTGVSIRTSDRQPGVKSVAGRSFQIG